MRSAHFKLRRGQERLSRKKAGEAATDPSRPAPQSTSAAPPAQSGTQVEAAKPVNALGLLWSVLVARFKSLFSRTPA